jgi:hypothetical protein
MLSAGSSPHRRPRRNHPFARSAGDQIVEAIVVEGERAHGCVEKIRLVLGVWCKRVGVGVYEVVMRSLVCVYGKVCPHSLCLRE